jgi:hypothetical protein
MIRAEFLLAVSAAWTPASGDPWAVRAHAEAFTAAVDRVNGAGLFTPPLPYADAVVVDGTFDVQVTEAAIYDAHRVAVEALVGEVTSVMRGADLLAGHIGDRPPVDPVAEQILGVLPNGELLVRDSQCPVTSRRCGLGCADRCLTEPATTLARAWWNAVHPGLPWEAAGGSERDRYTAAASRVLPELPGIVSGMEATS